jgi:hypothetical protein
MKPQDRTAAGLPDVEPYARRGGQMPGAGGERLLSVASRALR